MLQTKNGKLLDVEELSWERAISILEKIAPNLAQAISDLPEGVRYPFYKASYHFGTQIIDQGGVYLPLVGGGNISFNDDSLPDDIKERLGYTAGISNPIGIALNKKCEFYLQYGEKITPYTVLNPGEIFGLSKNFNNGYGIYSTCLWDLVAGAKSVFMLAKVSNNPQHTNLKRKFDLSSRAPTNYPEQWMTFKEIALKTDSDWRAEILFFDAKWARLLTDPLYLNLQAQISRINPSGIWHHQPSWDVAFGDIEARKHLIAYPADILDAARHLFSIAAGSFPGFAPAVDEMSAPIKVLQDAYTNVYELEHAAILMEPTLLSLNSELPAYYSLNWPTSPKSVPKNMENKKSVIFNLSILMEIIKTYQMNLVNELKFRAPSLCNAAMKIEFSFYDNDFQKYKGIKDVILLPREDKRFVCSKTITFPNHSSFLKGLIKISPMQSK